MSIPGTITALDLTAGANKLSHSRIAERAYALWLARGRPEGSDLQDWLEAEAELARAAGDTNPMCAAMGLRETEAFWSMLVQTTTDYITLLESDGTIRFVNHLPSGILPADVIGTSVYQFVPAEQQEPFRLAIDSVFRTGNPWSGEVAIILPRLNELHWYSTRIGPLTMDGRVIAVASISTDITEKKRAEEALRTSEVRFARFMEHLPGLAWIKDLDGRYLYANNAAERAFRMPRAQLYGKTDDEVFPPETAAQFRENDHQVLASGTGIQSIETLEHDDGIVHYSIVSKFPILGPAGKPALVGGIAIDITARKHAERLLAVGHAVTRTLAESADLLDAAPRIIQAICESLGWDVGAVWKVDRQTQVLRCVDVWHAAKVAVPAFERICRQYTFSKGVGLPGRVWATEHSAWIPDVTSDDNFPRAPIAAAEGLHAAFAFPIRNGVEFLGVIEFFSRRIQEPDEQLLEMMTIIGGQISQFIERREAERILHDRAREFALARDIQLSLLPRAMPVVPDFAFGGAAQFTQETGGDYYDFFPLGNPGLGIAIGDASGHGIAAALIMADARTSLRTLALTHRDPGEILAFVNRRLTEDLPADHFVTLFLARLDPGTHSLVYSSAGHCNGLVLRRDGTVRLELPSTGMPLGLELTAEFPSAPAVSLEPGDLVLLLTDGVLEAMSPDESAFGLQQALDVVRMHAEETPAAISQALLSAVQAFCRPQALHDDATAAIIRMYPGG